VPAGTWTGSDLTTRYVAGATIDGMLPNLAGRAMVGVHCAGWRRRRAARLRACSADTAVSAEEPFFVLRCVTYYAYAYTAGFRCCHYRLPDELPECLGGMLRTGDNCLRCTRYYTCTLTTFYTAAEEGLRGCGGGGANASSTATHIRRTAAVHTAREARRWTALALPRAVTGRVKFDATPRYAFTTHIAGAWQPLLRYQHAQNNLVHFGGNVLLLYLHAGGCAGARRTGRRWLSRTCGGKTADATLRDSGTFTNRGSCSCSVRQRRGIVLPADVRRTWRFYALFDALPPHAVFSLARYWPVRVA